MTQEMIQKLNDVELQQAIVWAEAELKLRAQRRKQDTIAKIKQLALQGGINIAINGERGRPSKKKSRKYVKRGHTDPEVR